MKPQNLILIPILIIGLGVLPTTQAVSPAPDGAYPGGNTAEGGSALLSLTTGTYNTAVGLFSLRSNTDGDFNTAMGAGALLVNTAELNTATGAGALLSNTIGIQNTANGAFALFSNTTAFSNTAMGNSALHSNITGSFNTATGDSALYFNTAGSNNTATGTGALASNTGGSNTATGAAALSNNITGVNNTALGVNAGNGVTTANNVIAIGTTGANQSNSCFVGQIFGGTSSGGTAVFINSDGKLGTTTSSRRFKEEIKPMERASEALFALKPVTFRYKKGIDPQGIPQFGLVAEDVDAVNPDLVVRDEQSKPYTVRYEAINAMLLNEFLKERRKRQEQDRRIVEQDHKVQEQQTTITRVTSTVAEQAVTIVQQQRDFQSAITRQEKEIKSLTASLKEQASQIQKVSDQLAVSKSAPRVVVNDR